MTSKRVDLYSFSTAPFSLEGIKKPKDSPNQKKWIDHLYSKNYFYDKDTYEMERHLFSHNDKLTLRFLNKDKAYKRSIQVSGTTGNIPDKDIHEMMKPAIIKDDYCINFGLYYADSGAFSKLTNAHQLYGVITENQSKWMERLFNDIGVEKYNSLKMSDLIFPGSHDAGMYTQKPGVNFRVASFCNTQKDDIKNQLALGARIFDFRPGILKKGWAKKALKDELKPWEASCVEAIGGAVLLENMYADWENEIRHIHNFIPGASYKSFLSEILSFLKENQNEIVIMYTVSNGISDAIDLANIADLDKILSDVHSLYPELNIGDKSSLKKRVKDIIDSNERLIIIGNDKIVGAANAVKSKSSYSDSVYQSDNSENVVGAISQLNKESWKGQDIVEFFLQMTAQATKGGTYRVITSHCQAASPLIATKAATDHLTYTWLLDGNLKKNNEDALITLYNDFYDGGLTATLAKVLRERIMDTTT